MPLYEYTCRECEKTFSIRLSVKDHERKRPKCPHCGSRKLTQQFSSFFAKTSKKS
jgi:putative FmdB family regulatory protein